MFFVILVALLMTSCSALQRSSKAPGIPTRGFLYRGESPEQDLGAYGYLLFTGQPDKDKYARYEHICDSYERKIRDVNEYPGGDRSALMITYWLLATHDENSSQKSECARLIDNYDYATADKIVSAIGKLSATGPILVAWNKPFGSGQSASTGLVLDMSDFADEDLDRAFSIWKDRIVRDPSVWQKGFNVVKAREAFRSLIQLHGAKIIATVSGK